MTPYRVQRHDRDDGSVSFEIWDTSKQSFDPVMTYTDPPGEGTGVAQGHAERIAAELTALDGA